MKFYFWTQIAKVINNRKGHDCDKKYIWRDISVSAGERRKHISIEKLWGWLINTHGGEGDAKSDVTPLAISSDVDINELVFVASDTSRRHALHTQIYLTT